MCQFNIILTEKNTDSIILNKMLDSNGFGFSEISNESIIAQTEFHKTIATTKNHCDCGSIIGLNHSPSSQKIDIDKERKKLKKKRWTDSKIERYISDKLKNEIKTEENNELGNSAEEDKWKKLIDQFSKSKIKFGLFHHQFNGPIEDELIEIEKIIKIKSDQISIEQLRNLRDCQLLIIT